MSTTRKQFDEYNTGCHELSSVHSTELNSRQPALYSYSTHSNHMRSWFLDRTPWVSPGHSENCHLLTSSLSLGVSVIHTTQCIRDV